MSSIINQKPTTVRPDPTLPDWRNLGVLLRVVLAVNAASAMAAFVREGQIAPLWAVWLDITAIVEPHLLFELAVLYVLSPTLMRLSYRNGILVVLALTAGLSPMFNSLLGTLWERPPSHFRYLVFSLAITVVMLGYFHLRSRALSPAFAEARLQALQARIRPHFLFNSINAVLSLIRAEPRRAETALEDMADLFRVLMRDNRDLAPLSTEVDLCRQYLSLEKLRLESKLVVEWHVENMPEDALVPPLILQPLLENAVYHGIEPASGPGTISINIFVRRGEVHIMLRNPFLGSARHQKGNRMAMGNIRERLALHFDAEAHLEAQVAAGQWQVHITLPYRSAANAAAGKSLAGAHG